MTRREALLAFIAGPFTAKGLAKMPATPPVVEVAAAINPMMNISFIASGSCMLSEQILKDLPRALKNGGIR